MPSKAPRFGPLDTQYREKYYDLNDWRSKDMKEYTYEVNVGSGSCNGSVFVPEGATDDQIRLAILDSLYEVSYAPVK